MAAPLADLHVALILRCNPSQLTQPMSREALESGHYRQRRVECGRVCFADSEGLASPDTAEVIFDPWLHAGFVVYHYNGMVVSGPDLHSVVYNWLPRALAGGF